MTMDDLIQSGTLIKSKINNLNCNRLIDEAIKEIVKEEKQRNPEIKELIDRPMRYNTATQNQIGEIFKPIERLNNDYEVSNYGRVRRKNHYSKNRMQAVRIISSTRHSIRGAFGVIIKDKFYRIQVLMYEAFKGSIEGKTVYLKDNNQRNLILSNLAVKANTLKYKPKKYKGRQIVIDLNTGNKQKKLKEMQDLRRKNYFLKSSENGVYTYNLLNNHK